jgi:ring-1,2-phenylacetyl-CoA epoxidase subunit PaaD
MTNRRTSRKEVAEHMAVEPIKLELANDAVILEGDKEKAREIVEVLTTVFDPEIPVVNLVELGMVYGVSVEGHHVRVRFMPTFMGCPALAIIKDRIQSAIRAHDAEFAVQIDSVFDPPWTTDRIMESAKEKLKSFGIVAPKCSLYARAWETECPYCGSNDTKVENLFGPTACRSVWYCNTCRQPFEAMKPL